MSRFSILLATVLMAGCAAPSPSPSLLPRAAEKQGFEEPAAPPPAAAAPDPALDAKIAAAQRALAEANAAFDVAAARAERLTRAGGARSIGSDAWLDAQTALAELDVLRAATVERLSDLEQLASDRALTLAPDYPALEASIDGAQAITQAEAARIAAIQAALPQP